MENKFKYICIPIIVLLALSFFVGLITNSIYVNPLGIVGSIILLGAIAFTVFAMLKKPLLTIGMLVISSVSEYMIGVSGGIYYNIYYANGFTITNNVITSLLLPIANVLGAIYLVWGICNIIMNGKQNKQASSRVLTNAQPNSQASLDAINSMSQELQQYKYLLDNGILSADEFAVEKAKVMKKYGFAPTVKQVQPQPDTQYSQFSQLLQVDGTYKFNDIVLTLAKAQYDFKNADSGTSLLSGTYILDSTKKVVTLFKPDKSLMQLSIDESGNLVTANGNVYEKQ